MEDADCWARNSKLDQEERLETVENRDELALEETPLSIGRNSQENENDGSDENHPSVLSRNKGREGGFVGSVGMGLHRGLCKWEKDPFECLKHKTSEATWKPRALTRPCASPNANEGRFSEVGNPFDADLLEDGRTMASSESSSESFLEAS